MTLGEQQRLFVRLAAKLAVHAYDTGFELTFGEAYRSDEQAEINAMGAVLRERLADLIVAVYPVLAGKIRNNVGNGIRGSLHEKRLAIDLNLFKGGVYLTHSRDYEPLGDYWKTLHPLARWGGDFDYPDGNHFSLEFEGVR